MTNKKTSLGLIIDEEIFTQRSNIQEEDGISGTPSHSNPTHPDFSQTKSNLIQRFDSANADMTPISGRNKSFNRYEEASEDEEEDDINQRE